LPAQPANVLSPEKWEEISLILGEIDYDLLQETCLATLMSITENPEEKVPQILETKSLRTIKEILLEKYPFRKDGVPAILEFVARLVNNQKVTEVNSLKTWLDKIASEKNINYPIYREPESSNISINAYLLITLEKVSEVSTDFNLQAELVPNHQEGDKPFNAVPIILNQDGLISCPENEIKDYIGRLIKAAKMKLIREYKHTKYSLTIELFLPVQYLGRDFDLEEISADQNRLKPIGYQYHFAVRSLDRYLINESTNMGDYLTKLEQRWLDYQPKVQDSTNTWIQAIQCLDLLDDCYNWDKFSTDWHKNKKLAINLAGGLPQDEKQQEFFYSLLRGGVPLSLWNRCPHFDRDDASKTLNNLIALDSLQNLSNLFAKVRDLRVEAHDEREKAKDYLGYHLGFLCDRPDRIPFALKLENQIYTGTD